MSSIPTRRKKLDLYEANDINIYNVNDEIFYEYHALFYQPSANALVLHEIKVDCKLVRQTRIAFPTDSMQIVILIHML